MFGFLRVSYASGSAHAEPPPPSLPPAGSCLRQSNETKKECLTFKKDGSSDTRNQSPCGTRIVLVVATQALFIFFLILQDSRKTPSLAWRRTFREQFVLFSPK